MPVFCRLQAKPCRPSRVFLNFLLGFFFRLGLPEIVAAQRATEGLLSHEHGLEYIQICIFSEPLEYIQRAGLGARGG